MKRLLLLLSGLAAACTLAARPNGTVRPAEAVRSREVTFARDFGTLRGTLLVPSDTAATAALIIAGSGPTDRNCNSMLGPGTDAFRYLAEALCDAGIASLRYDKRGVGESRYDDPARLAGIRFDDFVSDAAACAELLRREGFRRIVLVGHSEGALIALCAAQDNPSVDGVVSLCGPGFPMDRLIERQLAAQLACTDLPLLLEARGVLEALRTGRTTDRYPRQLEMLFAPPLQRYLLSQMPHDPQRLIARLHVPVCIVGGDNDLQVTAADAEALAAACPAAELHVIEGLTHALKPCAGRTPVEQIPAYTDRTLPLDTELTACVTRFIGAL